ncbi:MAG: lipoyl(octanoyl) transferase LipB [Chloroflexota bacterium]|nr:lipoyl(octanoyl) transferase LipB [Chloroflexota bacterium]
MTQLRDISAPPRQLARRELPFEPASSRRPLLEAHGAQLDVEWLGRVAYLPTWELQDVLAERRQAGEIGDRLLLLEHRPVYTIGRGGDAANLLADADRLRALGAEWHRVDRGGDVTFHGPGQLVAYPIVRLRDPLDLRRYVRSLEAAVVEVAGHFGVTAGRLDGLPGVWVAGERKLAAIGVRVRRGVTTHGLALNVATDLGWFDEMIPCGIPGKGVTSLSAEAHRALATRDAARPLADALAAVFGLIPSYRESGPSGPAGASEE